MQFSLNNLHAIQLTILASATIFHVNADYKSDSFTDIILFDASCPNRANGRLSIDNCHGYVDCLNGFEIDRATCKEGQLYSVRSENCEDASMVPACPRGVTTADAPNTDRPVTCGDGLCMTPDGDCGVMHQCLIDPCDLTRCGENEVCEPSYCGGCHAICTLKLNTVVQDMPTTTEVPTTRAPETTKAIKTTSGPILIDDGGTYVPEDASGSTSTSAPSVVIDGPDAVAPQTTTVAPTTTEADIPTTIVQTKDDTVDTTTSTANQVYVPSWTEHTCVPADPQDKKNKPSSRRLGASWHSSYSTQYECCVNNFIYSLELFESCVGFDLDALEPSNAADEYYPVWRENKCQAVDGTEDAWLQTTFREKKYLCCFEYMKWDFDNCLIA